MYKNSTFLKMAEEVPRILEEVVQGIDYLHSKKLVHMELNSNTITVWCYIYCVNITLDFFYVYYVVLLRYWHYEILNSC